MRLTWMMVVAAVASLSTALNSQMVRLVSDTQKDDVVTLDRTNLTVPVIMSLFNLLTRYQSQGPLPPPQGRFSQGSPYSWTLARYLGLTAARDRLVKREERVLPGCPLVIPFIEVYCDEEGPGGLYRPCQADAECTGEEKCCPSKGPGSPSKFPDCGLKCTLHIKDEAAEEDPEYYKKSGSMMIPEVGMGEFDFGDFGAFTTAPPLQKAKFMVQGQASEKQGSNLVSTKVRTNEMLALLKHLRHKLEKSYGKKHAMLSKALRDAVAHVNNYFQRSS